MEEFLVRLAHAAAWFFGLVFLFAAIGVIATIRWIIGLFFSAGRAVETGVQDAEKFVERR